MRIAVFLKWHTPRKVPSILFDRGRLEQLLFHRPATSQRLAPDEGPDYLRAIETNTQIRKNGSAGTRVHELGYALLSETAPADCRSRSDTVAALWSLRSLDAPPRRFRQRRQPWSFKHEWDFPTTRRLLMPFRATARRDIYQAIDVPMTGDLRGRH